MGSGKMLRREFLKLAGLSAAGMALHPGRGAQGAEAEPGPAAAPAASEGKPNILLFLADDYGLDGVSCYGSDRFKGKTPHLDALARSGLRFEQCYSTPLCGPTRCEITTGRYPFRTGGLTNQSAHEPTSHDEIGIAKVLKQAGYATGMAGKWRQMGETPGDWGFDEYLTDQTAGGHYWAKSYIKNGKPVELDKEVYCPDVCLEFAVDFMRRSQKGPFFLYYPTHLVHAPILKTPDSKGDGGHDALYDDNVAYLDKQLGQVIAELDKLGLREKTLILFTGDNGTAHQSGTLGGRQILGSKGTMQEGGARVPLIANWKGVTPQGKVLKDLVQHTDFFATFCELTGAKPPNDRVLDSHSFAAQLRGQAGKPREWIFMQLGERWYAREQDWKLNEEGALFDMKDAPFEEKKVAADTKDEAAVAARTRLQAVLDQLNPAAGKKADGKGEGKAGKRAKDGGGRRKRAERKAAEEQAP